MNASETFAAGGEQFTVPISIDLGGPTFTLTAADMTNPTPVLNAIPSGTVAAPVTVLLPAGEFVTEVSFDVNDKSWWHLIGGPTTLRFPTYGPITSGTTYGRRHFRINRCFDSTVSGIKIWGPHNLRHPIDPTRALSTTTDPTMARYEFQHAFQIGYSSRVTLSDVEGYEVGGDGLYIVDSYDLAINRLRVEFNGRQGLAGIGGTGWTYDEVEIVNAGRFAIDFEPIGTFDTQPQLGQNRWVRQVDIGNSKLKGGVIYHRVADIVLHDSEMRRGGVIAENGPNPSGNTDLSLNRSGIKILDNVWPDLWSSPTADAGPIRMNSINGLEVRGNTVTRDPANPASANSPLVQMLTVPVNGHLIVRGNNTNLSILLKWSNSINPADHAHVTEDVGP